MATIKSFTSLEQSKKLAEFLPPESADMRIGNYVGESGKVDGTNVHYYPKGESFGAPEIINAWSLAALFGVLPNKIVSHETAFEGEDAEGINDIYHKCIKPTEDGRYTCCYLGNGYKYEYIADNPIDACVDMIEKLHELKML